MFPRLRAAGLIALLAALAGQTAMAGAPFRSDDPGTTPDGHWEFDLFSLGTAMQQGIVPHTGMIGVLPGIEIDYGVSPRVSLHLAAPLGFNSTLGKGTGFGAGDTELGIKYRFLGGPDETDRPQIAFAPLVEVPTGNRDLVLSSGHAQVFLPLWIEQDAGLWSTYAGGGHWTSPGVGYRDSWFAGWVVQRQFADLTLGAEVFHQTANTTPGKPATGVNVGATYNFTDNWHALASAGRGVFQSANQTNAFSYYLALQLTY